jgi:crotonobetainyl-CoA:carnitine CoA-transferase CaiB-like acyl-CoA transferase
MFNLEVWFKKRKTETRRLLVKEADVVHIVNALSDMGKTNAYRVGKCADGKYYFAFESTNAEWEKFLNDLGRTLVLNLVDYENWFELV